MAPTAHAPGVPSLPPRAPGARCPQRLQIRSTRPILSTRPIPSIRSIGSRRGEPRPRAVAGPGLETATAKKAGGGARGDDWNQWVREGQGETPLVRRQAAKQDSQQAKIADSLPPWDASLTADVAVVGCGPAGLALAGELGKRGMRVVLVGQDSAFVNNYGVWRDEFRELGLEHVLECQWDDSVCFFGEGQEVRVGRGYGRVCRRRLRQHLLEVCRSEGIGGGVAFHEGLVDAVDSERGSDTSTLRCKDGSEVRARLVTLASGAAAGRFLEYETDTPQPAGQTAYGIEAEVEGYEKGFDPKAMLFMDYRRHHTGLWEDTAHTIQAGKHPNAGDGLWGTSNEVPSFLYAMPLSDGTVFLEETCLVARPALPFATLKRRLERRLAAQGIRVKRVLDEEWSYIPTGGPLPAQGQAITAFGAAANLIHPATGYSITRSFQEAPAMADAIVDALKSCPLIGQRADRVWDTLWSQEKRKQAAFHVFGMELLVNLDLASTNNFFKTFFRLPEYFWQGFLASKLSSVELLAFAAGMFLLAPLSTKYQLMEHFFVDPSSRYLVRSYFPDKDEGDSTHSS
ncbi:unnamed protein product [Ostreobium quekettii]|uniref:Uncharacterized protein n=1 Tax=Ostreobium quekettii TaxID=121088 RepID=A0A8S1IRS9_9CHLO|nr:unnamed protein product [Ostreobium quekettii]|eukprot:evm.model.scf_327EXC.4 EVM.evm.TU.scf_327EXC.4   scf_327EXC:51649-61323(-)